MDRRLRSIVSLAAALAALVSAGTALAGEPAAPASPGPPSTRELTMAQAIDVALERNPQLAIEAENVVAARAKARADSKLRLPLLNARAIVQVWDRELVVDLGPSMTMDGGTEDNKIVVRPRVTGSADFTVSQPLSGALVIGKLVERDEAATAASQAQRDGV
ncbi:MAG TPA: hypothetical protein VLM79_39120, partial [Kofleriaceae bacterium]|nr:hypothetical protein [Kofleriaceae bacterium]